jgi:hypothetical protein
MRSKKLWFQGETGRNADQEMPSKSLDMESKNSAFGSFFDAF